MVFSEYLALFNKSNKSLIIFSLAVISNPRAAMDML